MIKEREWDKKDFSIDKNLRLRSCGWLCHYLLIFFFYLTHDTKQEAAFFPK